ncbi:MAG: polysaccharide deacetylase family protein [Bacilli bacterium]|nr:polysaccharide deacetylase family protein [Bacilli bacterium]
MKKVKLREKVKKKKNTIFIVMIVIAIIILSGVGIVCYFDFCDNKLLKSIRNHYSKNVIVVKDTNIYDKNNKVMGKVKKDFSLILEDKRVKNSSEQYFKIKDTNYYVYYDDVKKGKVIDYNFENKYLVFNTNISNGKTVFYQNNREVLTVNDKLSLPIEYMDNDYYYVVYFGRLLQVKRSDNDRLVESSNSDKAEASYVSVINYYSIDSCNKDSCVSVDNVKQQLNYLKEQGFYSISVDEYKLWLEGKIRLREKAVLLTTNTSNDNLNNLNNEYELKIQDVNNVDLKFNDVNKKSTKDSALDKIERYVVKKNTTLENFKKMSNGEDVVEVVKTSNTEQRIAVLNYHFFYDPNLGEDCDESICLEVSKFREQLDYLKNNGYRTLKMEEFKKWMYGEMELPEKSVLITVDDGAKGTGKHNGHKLIPILEEYNMNATLFLISGWWDVENYRSKNLDIQSHTYDMHKYGSCGKGQLVCATKEQALMDLQKSLQIVDNSDSFCYPFYSYSDVAVQAVKEAGFKIAFVGGSVKARRSNNKYLIPRYPIYKSTTLNQFIKMVS